MLKQSLTQKLSQKLSPQQIQLMKLIQLPSLSFEVKVKQELEDNPALEEGKEDIDKPQDYPTLEESEPSISTEDKNDINVDYYISDDETPAYKYNINNAGKDFEDNIIPFAGGTSFLEFLTSQLNTYTLSEDQYTKAIYLLGNIDGDGYIRRDLQSIVDDLAFSLGVLTSKEELENILKKYIHKLEPFGVGARSLQECLLIQLYNKSQDSKVLLAITILTKHFEEFVKKHYQRLIHRTGCDNEELKVAVSVIEKLNPKPGKSYSGNTKIIEQIIPDFFINIIEGKIELTLEGRNIPDLKISRNYQEMLQSYKESKSKSKEQKKTILFVKQKLDSAKWFIDAIRQRQETLYVTMSAIIEIQKEYFLTGDESKLKPMILKDIADRVDLDISTISRVTNSKYVSTPYGTFLAKYFFSEKMKNEQGEDVSTREIKQILLNSIKEENKVKPLTDQKLAKVLESKGYPIARRTIAKYREQLNIPVARLRKKL